MAKKYVFDFDGTLVDSMGAWAQKMLYVLNKRGVAYPDDVIKIITPLGDKGTAEYFIEKLGVSGSVDELIADMDEYATDKYAYEIEAKPTVKATLERMKSEGYSLNVLTASPHRMLDVCLKRVGLYELFDNVWSCEDFGTTKSDVNIYHAAAERLGTTATDCVFLDDNINALITAKKSGMRVIGVYDLSSAEYEDDIRAVADEYVREFSELKF